MFSHFRNALIEINALKNHISGNTYPFEPIEGLLQSLSEDVIRKIIAVTRN